MTKVKTNPNTISYVGRNPHLDSLKAKAEAEKAVNVLHDSFDSVEKVGRRQLYKVNDSFYVLIVSAPSALKLDSTIRGLMKEYGKLPFYVLFTRETNTYPEASFDIYYAKVRTIYKLKGGFSGCILGLKELKQADIVSTMSNVKKIPLGLARYKAVGGNFGLDAVLKEMGLSAAKVKVAKQLINLISK
jgi:hypothetical protein